MTHARQDYPTIAMPYGRGTLHFRRQPHGQLLEPEESGPPLSPDQFRHKLHAYLSDANLDLSRPILVVTDNTRLCGYPEYLPVLTTTIRTFRGRNSPFPIIVAYGTHPRQSESASRRAYGALYRQWPFIHHDCRDTALFQELGTTSRGTPIRLRRDLLQASCVITMGPISHHYFAGYGGGRKLIFPGCGEREAIYHNHGLYLDRLRGCLTEGCRPGLLQGNPIAEDLFEVETHLRAHLAIHAVQDSHGRIIDLLIGAGRKSFLAACQRHGAIYEKEHRRFDVVVASCGGFPKDINFIQSHKAIHNGAGFVRDGGRLIVLTQCRDSIGSKTFLPWFSKGGFVKAFTELSRCYIGNGGTALAMMSKTGSIDISLITELDESICTLLGVEKWRAEEVERHLSATTGNTAWISNASLLVNRAVSRKLL